MQNTKRPPAFWLFPIGLVFAVAVSLLPGQWPLYVVLGVATALLGLPHGSLDTAVAKRYLPLGNPLRLGGFFAAYLALSAAVIAIWWQVPDIALAVFLVYSAVHFGDDVAARIGRIGGTGYGLWIVSLPVVFQAEVVVPLFEMLGSTRPELIVQAAPWSLALGGAMLLMGLVSHQSREVSDWRDPLLLVVAAGLLHPLAYFIAYWCFLHSPRHFAVTAQDLGLDSWREKLAAIAPTTLATYALAIAAIPFLIGLPADAMLMRLIFVGLAALTVPHMVVEFIAEARR